MESGTRRIEKGLISAPKNKKTHFFSPKTAPKEK
jgi:hypothetical protein